MGDDVSRVICLPGSELPNWFSHKGIDSSISFHVPSISKGQCLRLLLYVVCPLYESRDFWIFQKFNSLVTIRNKTRGNRKLLWPAHSLAPLLDRDRNIFTLPKNKEVPHSFIFPRRQEDHFFLYLTPLIRNKYELKSGLIFNELVMESGDEIEVSFLLWGTTIVRKCGVHVVVDEPNVM
jgi:hypothetical protein